MIVDMVPLASAVAGGSVGAYLAIVRMRKAVDAEKGRADLEKKRADEATSQRTDAQRELSAATALGTELRVRCATLQCDLTGQTQRAERAMLDLNSTREELAHERGAREAETRRANDAARELTEARGKVNELIRELTASRGELRATHASLKDAECLLAQLRLLYEKAENSARHHCGEHAYHQSMSESRLARIGLLEGHILDLRERLRAAETRAAQKEVMERIVELAKLILGGHALPALPGQA